MYRPTQKHACPSWLNEPCPPWCGCDHHGQDHPVDRIHASDAASVPVIERSRILDPASGEVLPVPHASEAAVMAVQPVGTGDVWVSLSTETHQLEVSLESLQRLRRPITELIEQLTSHRSR